MYILFSGHILVSRAHWLFVWTLKTIRLFSSWSISLLLLNSGPLQYFLYFGGFWLKFYQCINVLFVHTMSFIHPLIKQTDLACLSIKCHWDVSHQCVWLDCERFLYTLYRVPINIYCILYSVNGLSHHNVHYFTKS